MARQQSNIAGVSDPAVILTLKGGLISASDPGVPVQVDPGADGTFPIWDSLEPAGFRSSLATVDPDGNVSTPGSVRAGEHATVLTDAWGFATFGHADAPADFRAVQQNILNGQTYFAATVKAIFVGGSGSGNRGYMYLSAAGTRVYRGPDQFETDEPSAILQVGGNAFGGFLPPRLTTIQRDGIDSPAAGLIVFNSTAARLELFDGSDWVGLTTTA